MMILGEQLKSICPSLTLDRAKSLAALISELCATYKLTTKNQLQVLVAQLAHESGEFSLKTENMNYTTPQALINTWPSRFNLDGSNGKLKASDYTHNPEKLANSVYANRMGNGDSASGDGYKYRGGGFMQLTGKESYQAYANYTKQPVEQAALLVHTTDRGAMDSAFWEFVVDKKLLALADAQDFVTVTKRINGGTIGLDSRTKYWNLAKKYII